VRQRCASCISRLGIRGNLALRWSRKLRTVHTSTGGRHRTRQSPHGSSNSQSGDGGCCFCWRSFVSFVGPGQEWTNKNLSLILFEAATTQATTFQYTDAQLERSTRERTNLVRISNDRHHTSRNNRLPLAAASAHAAALHGHADADNPCHIMYHLVGLRAGTIVPSVHDDDIASCGLPLSLDFTASGRGITRRRDDARNATKRRERSSDPLLSVVGEPAVIALLLSSSFGKTSCNDGPGKLQASMDSFLRSLPQQRDGGGWDGFDEVFGDFVQRPPRVRVHVWPLPDHPRNPFQGSSRRDCFCCQYLVAPTTNRAGGNCSISSWP
jgi:hypothetical protein